MSGTRKYLKQALSILRGHFWRCRGGVRAKGGLRVLGPGCRLQVDPGGQALIGDGCSFDRGVEIVVYGGGRLELGDHVYVGHGSTIACAKSITIGADTLIGDLVSIRDMNHRRLEGAPMRESGIETRPIRIGKNCWLGSKVTLVAGCEIGSDVTVAANAVVAGRFDDQLLIGGVPARVLRDRRGKVSD